MTRKPTRNEFIAGTGALAWVVRFFFPRCTLTSSTVSPTPQGEVQQNIGGIYRLPCVTATAIAAFLFLRIQGEQPADILDIRQQAHFPQRRSPHPRAPPFIGFSPSALHRALVERLLVPPASISPSPPASVLRTADSS